MMHRCVNAGKTTGQLEAHLTGRAPEALEPQWWGFGRLHVWNKANAPLIPGGVGVKSCGRGASASGARWSSCVGISLEETAEGCAQRGSFSRARALLAVAGTWWWRCRMVWYAVDSCPCGVWLLPLRGAGSLRARALRGNSYEIIGLRRHGNKGCCSTTEK